MRRLLAILLLAAFGLPVAAPALALTESPDAHLPACCRRNGKHHCAMNLGKPSGAPAFSSICPNFPRPASTAPSGSHTALAFPATPATLLRFATTAAMHPAPQPQPLAEYSHPKRGPPIQIS